MEASIYIRLACEEDFDTIYSIWLDGIENSFDRNSVNEETLLERFERNFRARQGIFNYWIAERDGIVLGWQSLIKSSYNPFKEEKSAESSTYVSKNNRVKGVGEALIKYVIQEAEKSNLHYITAFVSVDNIAARKITQRTGWTEVGEIPKSLKDSYIKQKLFLVRPVRECEKRLIKMKTLRLFISILSSF